MPLPHNVFRATKDDWATSSWPAPFTVHSLEWRDHLPLKRLGGHMTTMPPGHRSGPIHAHAFEEEVFFVLEGVLTVRELKPGAATATLYDLRPGDLVVYPPGTWLAHGSENPLRGPGDVHRPVGRSLRRGRHLPRVGQGPGARAALRGGVLR